MEQAGLAAAPLSFQPLLAFRQELETTPEAGRDDIQEASWLASCSAEQSMAFEDNQNTAFQAASMPCYGSSSSQASAGDMRRYRSHMYNPAEVKEHEAARMGFQDWPDLHNVDQHRHSGRKGQGR